MSVRISFLRRRIGAVSVAVGAYSRGDFAMPASTAALSASSAVKVDSGLPK